MQPRLPQTIARIANWAANDPRRPAITDREGTLTFQQLWKDAGCYAASLSRYGVQEGDTVGLLLPNRKIFVAALLGILRAGAVAVLMPPSLNVSELRRIVQIAGTQLALAGSAHRALILEAGGKSCPVDFQALRAFAFAAPRIPGLVRDDCIIQLTSGADQPSKLAVRTHGAVGNEIHCFAEEIQLLQSDATLVLPSISHSYGLIGGTLAPLSRGGRVVLVDRFDPEVVVRIIRRERPSILFAVPVMYRGLLQAPEREGDALSSVRLCFSAGAPLPQDVDDAFARRFGLRISQDYGSTEAGVITLRLEWSPHLRDSVGRPVRGRDLSIVRPQGQTFQLMAAGEVVVGSPALARGYVGETGILPIDRCRFHTGDLGSVDENGHLFLIGRKSNLIHLAGITIDPTVVEAAIARIPGVQDAAVVGITSSVGSEVMKAVVVAEGVTTDDILRYCREHLPTTHVPCAIEFRREIPRSAAGKTLRRLLLN